MFILRLIRDEYQKKTLPENTFVKAFDPLAYQGRGFLTDTHNPTEAKKYPTHEAALREWLETPLRCYTAAIEPAPFDPSVN